MCNPWNHRVIGILLDFSGLLFRFVSQQGQGGNEHFGRHCPTKTLPSCCDIPEGRPGNVPATILKVCGSRARNAVLLADLDLVLWASFPFKTSRFFRTFLDLSGFGSLRLACGTAFSSVHPILSACQPLYLRVPMFPSWGARPPAMNLVQRS